jgi:hypothetical protein
MAVACCAVGPAAALAQEARTFDDRRTGVEAHAGSTGFIDEELFAQDHAIVGGAVRFGISPRVTLGPEVSYMVGPGSDRDLFVTGNLWFDVVRPRRHGFTVTPFLVIGAGLMRHSETFGGPVHYDEFSCIGVALTGGGGVRFRLANRWYVAPEVRLGWEPHVRLSVSAGYDFGR